MADADRADGDTMVAERPSEPKRVASPAEPATARALWPTFMRRTLADETLREPERA